MTFITAMKAIGRALLGAIRILTMLKRNTRLFALGLVVFSGYTTWFGLSPMFEAGGESDVLAWALPIIVAASVHWLSFSFLDRWWEGRGRRFLLGWVITALPAIAFSTGYHWRKFFGDEYVAASFRDRHAAAMQAMVRTANGYTVIRQRIDELAAYSNDTAKVEAEQGGTCGEAAGKKQGPRYRLRDDDKRVLENQAKQVEQRHDSFASLVKAAEALGAPKPADVQATVDAMRALLNRANSYAQNDLLLTALKASLKDRIQRGREPFPTGLVDEKGKPTTFRCHDAKLERGLAAVITAIEALPPLPRVEVENARDQRVAVRIVVSRILESARIFDVLSLIGISAPTREQLEAERRAQLRGQPARSDGLRPDEKQALAMAALVELMIFLFYLIDVRRGTRGNDAAFGRLGDTWESTEGDAAVADRIAAKGIPLTSAIRLIQDHSVRRPTKLHIVAPAHPETEEGRRLTTLMDALAESGVVRYVGVLSPRALRKIVRSWSADRQRAIPPDAVMLLYAMTLRQYWSLLRLSLRGSPGGAAEGPTPPNAGAPDARADQTAHEAAEPAAKRLHLVPSSPA